MWKQRQRPETVCATTRFAGAPSRTAEGDLRAGPVTVSRAIWLLFCLLGLGMAQGTFAATPQVPTLGGVRSRSYSGQFIVQTVPAAGDIRSRYVSTFETNINYVTLDPTLLPVSCERIKQLLWRELAVNGQWSGRIFLGLHTATSGDDPVTFASMRFGDGWQYRLDLPDLLERSYYVRSVVDVLLLEIANRDARERSAEIPAWLSEGLCQELLSSSELEIVLPPPRPGSGGLLVTTRVVEARKESPLAEAHKVLRASPPLTFQQLSWPTQEQLTGDAGRVFRSSAQLFVHQLLQLNNGPECLRAMLAGLPQHYNWQFAFLQAFRENFQRPLDVEKWWTLHIEHFTGRELTQTWPPEESWQKFDALIRSAVQVHAAANALPQLGEVKLQTIVRDWDKDQQTAVLQAKVRELEQLRLRLAPQFVELGEEYHRTLATYLEQSEKSLIPFRKKAARRHAANEAVKTLDRLDATLAGLRPLGNQAKAR